MIYKKIKTFIHILKSTLSPPKEKVVSYFSSSNNKKENITQIPKSIWVYWDSVQLPAFTDICIKNLKIKFNDYHVHVLNSENYHEFIDEMIFPVNIKLAHKSDLIRLSLLKKYGGIWIDATSIVFEDFDWILKNCSGDDVFLCYSDDCTQNQQKPIAENWLIAAPPNSQFIIDWLEEFRKSIFSEVGEEYYNYLSGSKEIIQNIPDLSYLRCYVAAALIMSKKSYNIKMVNSGSTGHFLNYELKSKPLFIACVVCFLNCEKFYIPPVLKFTSSTRGWVEFFIDKGLYTKKSIIGNLISNIKQQNE